MPPRKNSIANFTHWLLIIPGAVGSIIFIVSTLLILPNEWQEYKKYKNKIDIIEKKVYGASPDDMDGIRASVEKELELNRLIEDAKLLVPPTKKLFSTDLPALKNRISDNEKYIEKMKNL